MRVTYNNKDFDFPEGTEMSTVKKYLKKLRQPEPEPVPEPVKMDAGFYQREDGSYFELLPDGGMKEHGP